MDSSKSDAPPSYDANHAISTSTLSYGSSIQRRPPSTRTVFSWARLGSRATVLSRIHNLVTSPNYTPSSVAPIVDSCAATLSVSQFSNLLQSLNVRGHTAMYWAIVNDRREALSALVGYISQISSVCSDDLRTACMLVSDHKLFTQLGLELEIDPNTDKPLRDSLGHLPFVDHEVEVLEGDGMSEDHFVALFRFKRCQRKLRIAETMSAEFVARGRIWWLRISYRRRLGKWRISYGLSHPSLPARPEAVVLIEVQRDTRGHASRPQDLRKEHRMTTHTLLAPPGYLVNKPEETCTRIFFYLGDWLMNNNTAYLDCDGTLHVKLEITSNQ